MNKLYIRNGKYNASRGMFIYYEVGSNNFFASEDGKKIEVCYGPLSGGCDYWDLSLEHKKALLGIVAEHDFDTRKLLAYTRKHDMHKHEEVPNGLGVKLSLVGLDSNAFALLAAFKRAARKQGFTEEQYIPIIEDAQSGDYSHLLSVLMNNTN